MSSPLIVLEKSRRVYVRRPRRDDRAAFRSLVADSRAFHRPWLDDLGDAYFDRYFDPSATDRYGFFVTRRCDGALVGVINVSGIQRGLFQSAFVSYFVHAGHAGGGYMTEGLSLVVRHVFRTLKLHRLEANIQPGNDASIALVKRCGFRLEGYSPRYLKIRGRWRDHERWAILADDPRGGKA